MMILERPTTPEVKFVSESLADKTINHIADTQADGLVETLKALEKETVRH